MEAGFVLLLKTTVLNWLDLLKELLIHQLTFQSIPEN
jgi:hypothetical protein